MSTQVVALRLAGRQAVDLTLVMLTNILEKKIYVCNNKLKLVAALTTDLSEKG